jgi:hypothetical protein
VEDVDSIFPISVLIRNRIGRLSQQYEDVDFYTMFQGLIGMFENQARAKRYNISKALFACNLAEGSQVSPHVIKMMGYIETLTKLGCEIKDDMAVDVIL